MGLQWSELRTFSEEELILNGDETRAILLFFFPNSDGLINNYKMHNATIGFAQGLLIEAAEATYDLGYMKIVYEVFYLKPPVSVSKALKKFFEEASLHWFKNIRATDLTKIKIYESVRHKIEVNFRGHLQLILEGVAQRSVRAPLMQAGFQSKSKGVWFV